MKCALSRRTATYAALVWLGLNPVQAGTHPHPAVAHTSTALPLVRTSVVTPVFTEVAKLGGLADTQGDEGDQFGSAVAIEGDTAVVGVPGKDVSGANAGVALVFVRVAGVWTLQATLAPPSPAEADLAFGVSVAISNDTLVVGSTGGYSSSGAGYVYVRSGQTWSPQATLTGLDTGASDRLGSSVAISGDTAVVSAPQASTGFGPGSGATYVFTRTGATWSQQQKLLPADLAAFDQFGSSVAVDGNTVLIGADMDDSGFGENAGSAYVFTRTGGVWSQQQKLLPQTGKSVDFFGTAVALAGDVAVIGAPGVELASLYASGAGYVFERTGGSWTETATLSPPAPTPGARYGIAVAVSAGVAALGPGGDYPETPVYLFRAGGGAWGIEAALPSGGQTQQSFGTAVALSGGTLLAGAPLVDNTGAAFVFTFTAGAWAQQARLDNTGTTRGDGFGSTVAVDGDTMAVGGPADDTPSARGSGSVTLFTRVGGVWTVLRKLVPEPGETQRFGRSLALEGNLLVVGAGSQSYKGGSVYLFRKAVDWSLEQKLEPVASTSDFGESVATSAGTVLVGEPNGDFNNVYSAGAVSVFIQSGGVWVVQQRLLAPTPKAYSSFGNTLGIAGDVAVIGSPGNAPRAYVFRRAGGIWTFSQELLATQSGETFGTAIASNGSDLAVGSPGQGGYPVENGSVYVFKDAAGVYSLVQRLSCPSTAVYVRCGAWAALSGDTLLVGAPLGLYAIPSAGSAAMFVRSGGQWFLQQQLLASDPAPQPSFGASAALAGTQVVVGAPATDAGARQSGAVYVFGPASSDLSLSMTTSPLVVNQGDLVTVTLALTNGGPAAVTGAAVGLALQPGLVFSASDNGNCVASPAGATCSFGALAPGASTSVDFFAVAAAVGTFTSTATVASGGPTAQGTTTILAAGADVTVTIATSPPARRGQLLDYWLYVQNDGPGTAAAVQVTHPAPTGLTLDSVSGPMCLSLPCAIPRIPVGVNYTILVSYVVPKDYPGPDPIMDTATVTAANGDPLPGNNTATGATPLQAGNTRLRFYTLPPCRLVDTRDAALGGPLPLPPGPAFFTAAAGMCGVPYSARALALNVTVTQSTTAGYLKLYPQGATAPAASFVNYQAGQTRANSGVIGVDSSSRFAVEVGQGAGSAHVIVDVVGYFLEP